MIEKHKLQVNWNDTQLQENKLGVIVSKLNNQRVVSKYFAKNDRCKFITRQGTSQSVSTESGTLNYFQEKFQGLDLTKIKYSWYIAYSNNIDTSLLSEYSLVVNNSIIIWVEGIGVNQNFVYTITLCLEKVG